MLRPVPYPVDDAKRKPLAKLERMAEAAKRLDDRSCRAPPINVAFEAGTNAAGVDQPACTLCGDCCSGCNVGAKTTVQMTYLPDAVNHGAEIFTDVARAPRAQGGRRLARVLHGDEPAARRLQVAGALDRGDDRRARRRQPRLDRDPAALAARRASPSPTAPRARLHRQRRRAGLRLQRPEAGQRRRRRRAAEGQRRRRRARASPAPSICASTARSTTA